MDQRGFIYIAINTSIPGKVKIGRSSRVPEKRMVELSNTSVPTPFICVYSALVEDPELSEKLIHTILSKHRVSKSREFFDISPPEAIEVIRSNLVIFFDEIHRDPNDEAYFQSEEIEEIARLREEEERASIERIQKKEKERKVEAALDAAEEAIKFFSSNEKKIARIIKLTLKAFVKPNLLNRLELLPRLESPGLQHFGNLLGKHLLMEVTHDGDIDISEYENKIVFDRGRWQTGLGLHFFGRENSLYLGQWEKGIKKGFGIYFWSEQHYFIGEWRYENFRLGIDNNSKQRIYYKSESEVVWEDVRQSVDLSRLTCLSNLQKILTQPIAARHRS